ncbi:MAG: PAS domain S-box protein [Verrucomicrobia bacterium]|nr:PAS domain S-box protein [Verrucomicrobiota bacterium]
MKTELRSEPLLTAKVPLRDDYARIVGLLGMNRNTGRRRADEQLLMLSRVVEQSATMVLISNSRGDIEYVNPKFTQVTGYTLEELAGENVRILKSGHTPSEEYTELWSAISAGREWRGQFCNKKKNGDLYWATAIISSIRNAEGVITHYVSVQEDITERKQAEEQLRQLNVSLLRKQQELLAAMEGLKTAQMQLIEAEKMKTIGCLAAGVAHEVKNPLGVIRLGLEYLSHQTRSKDPDTAQVVDDMSRAVARASSVVGELLSLGKAQELVMETVDLHKLLDSSLALLRVALATDHVKVVFERASSLPALRLDARKVEQVFINLIINAIHAMPDGGTLTVRTCAKQLDPTEADTVLDPQMRSRFRSGDTVVVVEIDDTGTGIPEDKLPKVFEPFFTTKAEGKGTGLGLTVCKTIIGFHGGVLNLRNRPEGGVRVSIMFKA